MLFVICMYAGAFDSFGTSPHLEITGKHQFNSSALQKQKNTFWVIELNPKPKHWSEAATLLFKTVESEGVIFIKLFLNQQCLNLTKDCITGTNDILKV